MVSSSSRGDPGVQASGPREDEPVQESAGKRKRKIGGPFRRSKTGCGTCKRRGKKCDEEWSDDGFCQRCITGAWDCSGRTDLEPGSSRRRTESTDADSGRRPATTGLDSPDRLGTNNEQSRKDNDPAPSGSPERGAEPPCLDSHTGPAKASNWTNPYQSQPVESSFPSISPNTSTLPTVPPSLTSNSVSISPETSISFSQPLFGWQNSSDPTSAFLNSFADGSLSVDSGHMDWSSAFAAPFGHQTHWSWSGKQTTDSTIQGEDFADLFGPSTSSNSVNHQTTAEQRPPINGPGLMDAAPRVVFVNNGNRPTRRGVSLAEIYARVVESWLVGLPSTTRDYARARIMALNDNNSVMRAVRYAVATAYIFLYAADPQGAHKSQPKLVELAYRGAGVSRPPNESLEPNSHQHSHSERPTTREGMSKKLRLYVDTVSTPFSSDSESARWTDDAIRELAQVVVRDKTQLSDLLWGVIDLQLVEFIRGGAAPSYDMLALGDRLVQAAYGELHPTIVLSHLRSLDSMSLRLFAISDICRCIVHRRRRTLFNFRLDHSTSPATFTAAEEEPWTTYLGFQEPIVLLLADVVNLCASVTTMSKTSVLSRAEEVERAIRDWQPAAPVGSAGTDPTAVISRTIAGQLWRLCALILLYQSVHHVGILHPTLRKARSEMLSLLDSIVRLPNGDLWGFIGLPSFLAATLSTDEPDRQRSMQHMMRPGPERMWLDNIALVEKVWEEVDETGRSVDWYDKMQREGMSVAFF